MSRDYAKKTANKAPAKRGSSRKNVRTKASNKAPAQSPRWLWLCSGFLLGILSMGLIQLWKTPQQDISRALDEVTGTTAAKNQQPHFDFYTQLRDAEIVVPDSPPDALRKAGGEKGQDEVFILQAGSFKNPRDADSLRVSLILLNLNAQVEKTHSSKGGTWHRVLVGPFQSSSKLAHARSTLLQNGIDNLVLKRPKN
ncbi:MAG: SPOR domain-containing protein [Gammaproteobacteria bacterium]|nr:SPOR domain-containing protein [Gammaproteobacteria bacterium]